MMLSSRDETSPVVPVRSPGESVPISPLRSFHEWLEEMNSRGEEKVSIRDFDGLDRGHFEQAYDKTPMTERGFQQRLGRCTIMVKVPQELR